MISGHKIQIVFFDLGGVVLNFRQGFTRLSAALGVPQVAVEKAYFKHVDPAARGATGTGEFWSRIRQELNIPQDGAIANYEDFWTDSFAPIPETHRLMRELAASHKLGILSNTERGVFEQV